MSTSEIASDAKPKRSFLSSLKGIVSAAYGSWPQLAIVCSFSGSALALKLAAFFHLLPAPVETELVFAYGKFIELPYLKPFLGGILAREFILTLAVAHLFAVALLVLPSGRIPCQAAGLWTLLAMAGAEYCTQAAGFVPPMTPPEFVWHAAVFSSFTHAFLFLSGGICVLHRKKESFGLIAMISRCFLQRGCAKNQPCKDSQASPVAEQPKVTDIPTAAQTPSATSTGNIGSRKRNSTPPPKASPASSAVESSWRKGTAAQRGAAALS
jgi:hypothetical protein